MTIPAAITAETAESVFGDRLELAGRFAKWLTGPGMTRGLLGPREADQIWERHLLNGLGIAGLIDEGSVVLDLGSGAGLPGIPLLLARPDLQMVLVEPKARRAEFLLEVCADLGLSARVLRARATPAGLVVLPEGTISSPVQRADVVTARAVASIADLARWAAPLLQPCGQLLAIKGNSASAELTRDRDVLTRLGFRGADVVTVGTSVRDGTQGSSLAATVVRTNLGDVSRET